MASTYSNLKFELMATGENNTTWGTVTNVNLGTAIEEAIAGSADVAFASANVTLTLTDTNASQAARNMRLNLTGTATAGFNLVVPAIEKAYIVNNATDGTITVKNATGSGVAVPSGRTMWVFNTGTNVVAAITHLTSLTLAAALPVASGGTGATDAAGARAALGAGTVTSVGGTGTVNGITLTGTVSSSGNLTLGGTLSGVSLTSQVSGTLPIANGGTNATTAGAALTNLGAYAASNPSGFTSNTGTVTSVGGTGTVNGLTLTGTVSTTGNLTLGGSVTSVATGATIDGVTIGYRNIPRSTTSGTAVVGDVGKVIAVSAGITVPNSTFAAGDAISIYNDSAAAITITAGVGTLRLAGTTTTGNRTLAARGMATIWFNSATEAVISGAGVS